jgi:hypothetical protein
MNVPELREQILDHERKVRPNTRWPDEMEVVLLLWDGSDSFFSAKRRIKIVGEMKEVFDVLFRLPTEYDDADFQFVDKRTKAVIQP